MVQQQHPSMSYSYNESKSRQQSTSTQKSGQQYTPQQQSQLDYLLPELQSRLTQSGEAIGQGFENYFNTFRDINAGDRAAIPNVPIVSAYTQPQMQKRINQYFADAETRTGTEQRTAERRVGSGMGLSPGALAEVQGAASGRNYAAATQGATEFELGAARTNADLEMQSWLARLQGSAIDQQWGLRNQQNALSAYGMDIQRENALLNAMNVNLRPLSFSEGSSSSTGSTDAFGFSTSQGAYGSGFG